MHWIKLLKVFVGACVATSGCVCIARAEFFDSERLVVSNCAFNSVAAILYHYSKTFTEEQLIDGLHLGPNLQSSASFANITELLESFSLTSAAVAGASPEDVVNAGTDAIVQLLLGNQYHFIALIHSINGKTYIFDYPSRPRELTSSNCEQILRFRMTGRVLFVSDQKAALPLVQAMPAAFNNPDLLKEQSTPANLQRDKSDAEMDKLQNGEDLTIPKKVLSQEPSAFQSIIAAIIPISNHGNKEIAIFDPRGACTCFKGLKGPKKIKPNSTALFEASFDKDTLMRSGQTAIAFRTDDEDLPVAEIKIACSKRKSPPFFCSPVAIDLGISSKKALNKQEFIYSVYVPVAENVVPQLSVGSIVPPIISAVIGVPHNVWVAGSEFIRTDVHCKLNVTSFGAITADILISTNNPGDKNITLALRGYAAN